MCVNYRPIQQELLRDVSALGRRFLDALYKRRDTALRPPAVVLVFHALVAIWMGKLTIVVITSSTILPPNLVIVGNRFIRIQIAVADRAFERALQRRSEECRTLGVFGESTCLSLGVTNKNLPHQPGELDNFSLAYRLAS